MIYSCRNIKHNLFQIMRRNKFLCNPIFLLPCSSTAQFCNQICSHFCDRKWNSKIFLRTKKYFCFDPKLRESSFNLGARVGNFIIMRPRARANLRANTNRGNVHCKQNCFRGVLLFKTLFAEFCVKSGRKTEPWNWAVRDLTVNRTSNSRYTSQSFMRNL